jgi:hypothetical protein
MSDMERSEPDDTEGQAYRQDAEAVDKDDVEGHALRSQDQDLKAATDDVEGHSWR